MRYARAMVGLLSVSMGGVLAVGADTPPKRSSFEVELIFERIDLSGDDFIDRAEFLQFSDYAPRLRGNPTAANLAFDRLDANKDGLVSKAEYLPAAERPDRRPGFCLESDTRAGTRGRAGPGRRAAHRRCADHARAARVLRGEDPPGADRELLQMPRGVVRQDQGELRSRHAGGYPQGGRPGRGGGAGQPRGEPLDPGGPLQGRRPQDAPENEAVRRGDRRPRALGRDGCSRPPRRQDPGDRQGDR